MSTCAPTIAEIAAQTRAAFAADLRRDRNREMQTQDDAERQRREREHEHRHARAEEQRAIAEGLAASFGYRPRG